MNVVMGRLIAIVLLYVFTVSPVNSDAIEGEAVWRCGTGHQYVIVGFGGEGQPWANAFDEVDRRFSDHHLATITSQSEQDFVDSLMDEKGLYGQYWIGGYQDPLTELRPDAGWTWVTGEPWIYTNWAGGEPNDTLGLEQHLTTQRWGWNDEGTAISSVAGYIAESFYSAECGSSLGIYTQVILATAIERK